mmetsp:Transcript_21716/g.3590  ORF Transcript_21716/g.3590 Transcript_21716/m.3590 type:complete len:80 (-) Transcript_21716:486-725(-)
MDEFIDYFSKVGVIRISTATGLPVAKLYKDNQGHPKGDGLISFAREESVPLAIKYLNNQEIKPGFKIKIDMVDFITGKI